ncbi:hypothetical protein BMS3Abin17_00420 [archaeon BMS3Abin17]|nr:hypothetical protein BMS3Abin17_00420 [archaeon BMS3Abin17]
MKKLLEKVSKNEDKNPPNNFYCPKNKKTLLINQKELIFIIILISLTNFVVGSLLGLAT